MAQEISYKIENWLTLLENLLYVDKVWRIPGDVNRYFGGIVLIVRSRWAILVPINCASETVNRLQRCELVGAIIRCPVRGGLCRPRIARGVRV